METSHYYAEIAAAFVRGKLGAMPGLCDQEIIRAGINAGLRLHKFKRNTELPRVRKVLGLLRGLVPSNLLDIGSGRGTFLWPLIDSFPELPITAIDNNPVRADNIGAVRRGGITSLDATLADAANLCFAEKSFDVVTILEVMEHLPSPEETVKEITRIAQRFIVASVPSKEDDNPEHIHLFDNRRLESMFLAKGAKQVKFDYVLNHIIAIVKM